jgi:hypothetical protein
VRVVQVSPVVKRGSSRRWYCREMICDVVGASCSLNTTRPARHADRQRRGRRAGARAAAAVVVRGSLAVAVVQQQQALHHTPHSPPTRCMATGSKHASPVHHRHASSGNGEQVGTAATPFQHARCRSFMCGVAAWPPASHAGHATVVLLTVHHLPQPPPDAAAALLRACGAWHGCSRNRGLAHLEPANSLPLPTAVCLQAHTALLALTCNDSCLVMTPVFSAAAGSACDARHVRSLLPHF